MDLDNQELKETQKMFCKRRILKENRHYRLLRLKGKIEIVKKYIRFENDTEFLNFLIEMEEDSNS